MLNRYVAFDCRNLNDQNSPKVSKKELLLIIKKSCRKKTGNEKKI